MLFLGYAWLLIAKLHCAKAMWGQGSPSKVAHPPFSTSLASPPRQPPSRGTRLPTPPSACVGVVPFMHCN